MKSVAFLALATCVVAEPTVQGGTLKLTWSDCGDSSTHGKITGLTPGTLILGTKTVVTGSGTVDEQVTGGSVSATVKASIITKNFSGDICKPTTWNLPLGVGSIAWSGLKCPVAAGAVAVPTEIQMSSALPASLAKANIQIKGTSTSGDKLLCMSIATAPAMEVHPERAAQIEQIQATPGVLWTAAAHPRFSSLSPGASKDMNGVKGDQQTIIADLVKRGEIMEHFADANTVVPDSFDSAENWPQCAKIIGDIRDQSNCGCCWAFAGAEAGSDRMCIATNASIMIPLSAQDVCFNGGGFMSQGCNGGQISSPWSYLKKGGLFGGKGAVSGGQYQGSGAFGKGLCSDFSLPHCHHHGPQGQDPYPAEGKPGCPKQTSAAGPKTCDDDAKAPHNHFAADKYSYTGSTVTARGEANMQSAIMAGGPMEVAFTVYSDFENYVSGIYHHVSGGMAGGHAVKVVGWGAENGQKYWKIANSWNPYWGEKGYFRIRRGNNEGGIEDQAIGSAPDAKWSRVDAESIVV